MYADAGKVMYMVILSRFLADHNENLPVRNLFPTDNVDFCPFSASVW